MRRSATRKSASLLLIATLLASVVVPAEGICDGGRACAQQGPIARKNACNCGCCSPVAKDSAEAASCCSQPAAPRVCHCGEKQEQPAPVPPRNPRDKDDARILSLTVAVDAASDVAPTGWRIEAAPALLVPPTLLRQAFLCRWLI